MGVALRGDRDTALVVDRLGTGGALCPGVDRTFFCGAQQASDVRTSAVVVVGGSEDGGDDVDGEDGGRGEEATKQIGNKPTELRRAGGAGLFGADGENLLVLDFQFDGQGRTNVAALNHGPADPDVAGNVDGL